jgi:quercetin dioxygenase-like cupin family protein
MNQLFKQFETGEVALAEGGYHSADKPWNAHPSFKGVYLKHLVTGAETGGQLSCHLVRIDPGCAIEDHLHDGKLEIHEVIGGSGECMIEQKAVPYTAGQLAVIPANLTHRVVASGEGLELFAKFAPALL